MKKNILSLIFALFLVLALDNCHNSTASDPTPSLPQGATQLSANPQRSGSAAAGYDYLIKGDYVSSGIPYDVYVSIFGNKNPDDLGRTGDAKGVAYNYNVVTSATGVKMVVNNCLSCHAEKINGQLVVGLGNNTVDYTHDKTPAVDLLDQVVRSQYGMDSKEWKAYYPYSRGLRTIGPNILTDVQGVNPAQKIFALLAAHRKSDDLTWLADVQFGNLPGQFPATKVPAWWNVKKKNALYFTGLGQKDLSRIMLASELLTMADSVEARKVDAKAPDVLAWMKSMQPPKYPFPIDQTLAATGKTIFEKTCSSCHGTYGANPAYPNFFIAANVVGTDPALANDFAAFSEYSNWYNGSWFGKGAYAGNLVTSTLGYVAPPLDGVWATAPFLHNGSVPTLDDLLQSSQRPAFWTRSFDNSEYDPVKVGWKYTAQTSKTDTKTYDSTKRGYGNKGHTYGDALSAAERKAVVEYLKTL